jgi:hypothetical protein
MFQTPVAFALHSLCRPAKKSHLAEFFANTFPHTLGLERLVYINLSILTGPPKGHVRIEIDKVLAGKP